MNNVEINFNPGTYTQEFESEFGSNVWEFLKTHDSLLILETSTFLHRPALEGLQPKLLEAFDDKIREDRNKQMIGRMVRQIMECHGYSLDRTGVKIRNGDLFVTAARYRK